MELFAINTFLLLCWLTKVMMIKADTEVFNQCIRNSPNPGFLRCIGQQTLSSLHNFDKMDNITVANGFLMIKNDDPMQRTFTEFFTEDPMDFRGMLENAGTLVGQRSLQWELGGIHPGLCMRIGPYSDSNSVLEFVVDPNIDRGMGDRYLAEEPSTARILTKQFLIPFLLGLKFNLITILPLVFAGIILLLKKAVFLGKFAMFISGLLGLGGLFSFGQFAGIGGIHRPHLFGGGAGFGGPGFGGVPHDSLSGGYYKGDDTFKTFNNYYELATTEKEPNYMDGFYNYEKKIIQEKSSKVFDKEPKVPDEQLQQQQQQQQQQEQEQQQQSSRANAYRSFAWKTI